MLTCMSLPETTCSASHLQARGSAGRCRLAVFRNQASRTAGAPPPSSLPGGCLGFRRGDGHECLWVSHHLGVSGAEWELSITAVPPGRLSLHRRVWKTPKVTWPVSSRTHTRPPDAADTLSSRCPWLTSHHPAHANQLPMGSGRAPDPSYPLRQRC